MQSIAISITINIMWSQTDFPLDNLYMFLYKPLCPIPVSTSPLEVFKILKVPLMTKSLLLQSCLSDVF